MLVRVEAALLEVSLTGVPAYLGAQIAGVRAESLAVVSRSLAEARLALMDW
ncbi:HK97 family phage prohead protease [Mycobacterium tuberculosis]|nr:HK97 family phage prohead protease [Mycobacterium tuberculosis]